MMVEVSVDIYEELDELYKMPVQELIIDKCIGNNCNPCELNLREDDSQHLHLQRLSPSVLRFKNNSRTDLNICTRVSL